MQEMEAVGSSETTIIVYMTTWLHISEDTSILATYQLQESNDSARRYNTLAKFSIPMKLH
jgi:hypothetical protein